MTMKMTSTEMRQRTIRSAWLHNGEEGWTLGRNNVVDIVVYDENGQAGNVPYLQIVFCDGRECRANAANYIITYAPPEGV